MRNTRFFALLISVTVIGVLIGGTVPASAQGGGPTVYSAAAFEGYTLFTPLSSTTTYLIDNAQLIHTWESSYRPGNAVYLLENGHLLRTGTVNSQVFTTGGIGGVVEEYTWEGALVWRYEYATPTAHLHHDIERLPNGNLLMIAWEYIAVEDVLAAGRNPDLLPVPNNQAPGAPGQTTNANDQGLWADHIIEVDPTTSTIVWEWHVWDHLVQDYDATLPTYGDPAAYPQLIDLNYIAGRVINDWNHSNAIDYNPDLDQIMLSVHSFSEIWIIDHSTTTAEAAGSRGDLLYRWGNPAAYGTSGAQQLYVQHDTQWIAPGLPGAGNILIFNNGSRQQRPYSTVEEITPPLNADGSYTLNADGAYGPAAPSWTYTGDFYAQNISGAQRLPNGNTLICDCPHGTFYEVTPAGSIVWQYVNPIATQRQDKSANEVFRAERYAPDFPGLAGRDLTPGDLLVGTTDAPGPSANGPNAGNGPPQAAFDACAGASANDACSIEGLRGTIQGTCRALGQRLVCAPQNVPGGAPGNAPPGG
ncbi:MAG: aryl-sulfate sulfotransferase [Anaerolineae bacterium]|nr:aryl-sulfate sulfotransferase [Anaerolineae bacterium]